MLISILLAALASPAAAVPPASCLHVSSGTAPSTFDEFRRCQDKMHAAVVDAAASKGAPLTEAQLDKLDDAQRAEARKFLAQPGFSTSGPSEAGTGSPGKTSSKGKLGGATAADLGRLDAKSGAAVKGLGDRLQAAAGDGKAGITPSMADDARATLIQAQGSISPDMQDLLNGVQKDGGTLTSGTMKKLQGAGKAAKGEGLDLNIDPAVEKQLLNSDFNKEKPADDPSDPGM
jgi:hypothetical protein